MKITSFFIFLLVFFAAKSQENKIPYGWLAGSWTGDGFGGTIEEVWSDPSDDGTMMGSFRHFNADGKINFYEYFLLDSSGLILKHFDKNFVGWEEKDEFLFFKTLEITDRKVIMEGLIYELLSDSTMRIHLDMKTEEGKKTEIFTMRKKR